MPHEELDKMLENDEELKKLELPRMNLGSLVRHFGPGLILMMTGIGTSHLVTAPTAGGRFAYALLCLVSNKNHHIYILF